MANLYSDCPPVTKITVERYPQSKYAAIIVPSNKRVPVDTKNRLNGERRIPITLDDVYGDSIYFFYVVGHEFPKGALPPYRKVVRDDEGVTPEIRAIMEKFWEHGNKRRPWKEEEK